MRSFIKFTIIILIIVAILAGGLWYGYYHLLPKMVGKAIVENSEPSVLPGPYKAKISRLRKPVNRATEKLIHEIDSLNIPFAAILRLIDETENNAVLNTVEELKSTNPTSPDAIFNIVKRNIPSREF